MKLLFLFSFIICHQVFAQKDLYGKIVFSEGKVVPCLVGIKETNQLIRLEQVDSFLFQKLIGPKITLSCVCEGYLPLKLTLDSSKFNEILILKPEISRLELEEVKASAKRNEISRIESPLLIDVYDKRFLERELTPSFTDVVGRINGVKSQVNCNVCGTSDIHINGMEGAYSLIVLDGVPIVGGLSTVYGLSGIPSFLIESMEVTKGPSSAIYGSEAMGGVIHVKTRTATEKPQVFVQQYLSSHGELNTDLGMIFRISKKWSSFTGINHFWMNQRIDANQDLFTDVPLQHRFSAFQKFSMLRKNDKKFDVQFRLLQENRWGGELNWNPQFRGSDSIYGESIDTKRLEWNVLYEFPGKEKITFLQHNNYHFQDSYYGDMYFKAQQWVNFSQLTWEKKTSHFGLVYRNQAYEDNTEVDLQGEQKTNSAFAFTHWLGVFLENKWRITRNQDLLSSLRVDYQSVHGIIPIGRFAYKWKMGRFQSFQASVGNGFRAVNLFSEDHAALTGARTVEITEKLKPERNLSLSLNYTQKIHFNEKITANFSFSPFYTHFDNRIVPDYDSDPTKISYSNLNGFARIFGVNSDVLLNVSKSTSLQLGMTYKEAQLIESKIIEQQILTEKWSGNWTLSHSLNKIPLTIDYTGVLLGKMRLPLAGDLDPRPEFSRIYAIHHLQLTYSISTHFQVFTAIKNIGNWTPAKGIPFLIARTNDPFDKEVLFSPDGSVLASSNNPYALSFDPSYVYAQNQGRRFMIGFRWNPLNKKEVKKGV
jgi:outer membrane receptor for ferrienterochelin and colicins